MCTEPRASRARERVGEHGRGAHRDGRTGRAPARAQPDQVVAAVAVGAEREVASRSSASSAARERRERRASGCRCRAAAPGAWPAAELARERVLHARAEIGAALRLARGSPAARAASCARGLGRVHREHGLEPERARPRQRRLEHVVEHRARRSGAACSGVKGGQSRVFTWPGARLLREDDERAASRARSGKRERARAARPRARHAHDGAAGSRLARRTKPSPIAPASRREHGARHAARSRARPRRDLGAVRGQRVALEAQPDQQVADAAARCACASRPPGRCSSPSWSEIAAVEARLRRAARLSSSSRPERGTPASMRSTSSVSRGRGRERPRASSAPRTRLGGAGAGTKSWKPAEAGEAVRAPPRPRRPGDARPRAAVRREAARGRRAAAREQLGRARALEREARARSALASRERHVVGDHVAREPLRARRASAARSSSSQKRVARARARAGRRRCGPARVSSSAVARRARPRRERASRRSEIMPSSQRTRSAPRDLEHAALGQRGTAGALAHGAQLAATRRAVTRLRPRRQQRRGARAARLGRQRQRPVDALRHARVLRARHSAKRCRATSRSCSLSMSTRAAADLGDDEAEARRASSAPQARSTRSSAIQRAHAVGEAAPAAAVEHAREVHQPVVERARGGRRRGRAEDPPGEAAASARAGAGSGARTCPRCSGGCRAWPASRGAGCSGGSGPRAG